MLNQKVDLYFFWAITAIACIPLAIALVYCCIVEVFDADIGNR
jgi:succinate dehydrogenase hydrophobic anchor subunit